MRLGVTLALLCCGLAAAAQPQPEATRFERTVAALQQADGQLRSQFATVALVELGEVYLAEADLAQREALTSEDSGLQSWSLAVARYAEQLLLVRDDVALGQPVALRRYYREAPAVAVAGRTIMLAHPRASQQAAYEQRVLARFCAAAPCDELTGPASVGPVIPVASAPISPEWEFSSRGPVCRHRHLALQFSGGTALRGQRARCSALMREAESLAAELAWQSRHGVAIDWAALSTSATAHRPEHLVALNAAGDSLLLSLPEIHGTPGLLAALTPWLRQRFSEGAPAAVVIDVTALGWE